MSRKGEHHRKYTMEEKLAIVQDGKENGLSRGELSAKYRISVTTIRDWVRQYEEEGVAGLSSKRIPGTPFARYTPEFRLTVVRAMIENDWTYRETAEKYGINRSVVHLWMSAYQEKGAAGLEMQKNRETKLENPKRGRPRKKPEKPRDAAPQDKELMAELHRLRMENAYLKKLNALAREKELLVKKKKPR